MKALHTVTYLLMAVGALNWGLVALFNFNLVTALLGAWPTVEKLIYILVGVSAVLDVTTHAKNCKMCGKM